MVRPRLHHVHAVGTGAHHRALGQIGQGGLCRLLHGVGPHSHLIGPVDPGHKTAVQLGVRRGVAVRDIGARDLDVIAAHRRAAQVALGIGILSGGGVIAIVHVPGLQHGDLVGALPSAGQLHKVQVAVIIAKAIACAKARVVLQMGAGQLPRGVVAAGGGQTHPDLLVGAVCARPPYSGHTHCHCKENSGKLHNFFLHGLLHFSVSSGLRY